MTTSPSRLTWQGSIPSTRPSQHFQPVPLTVAQRAKAQIAVQKKAPLWALPLLLGTWPITTLRLHLDVDCVGHDELDLIIVVASHRRCTLYVGV